MPLAAASFDSNLTNPVTPRRLLHTQTNPYPQLSGCCCDGGESRETENAKQETYVDFNSEHPSYLGRKRQRLTSSLQDGGGVRRLAAATPR